MAELVDAQDLKSCDFGHAGSIPALGIIIHQTKFVLGKTSRCWVRQVIRPDAQSNDWAIPALGTTQKLPRWTSGEFLSGAIFCNWTAIDFYGVYW